jgi:epoxyqueuosine reductase
MILTDDIKHKALELGFDVVGVTDASPLNAKQAEFLADWLKAGYADQMSYMHRNFEKRINPTKLLGNAQSIIVVGLNYKPSTQNLKRPNPTKLAAKVAQYAQYEDYHLFIKKQLRQLTDSICSIGKEYKSKICVDSVPLAERAFAVRAGLGFIGKNRMLINPALGPQIFLGEIITTLKLQTDAPIAANCSGCNKCIAACPTGALRADGQFDANKCISYLTIEYKGQIPADLAEKIGDRLFGCDDCVLACPYQQNAPVCTNKQFKFYSDRAELKVDEALMLGDESFKTRFADSVIKRLGLAGLKRNAQICLNNFKFEISNSSGGVLLIEEL